MFAFEGSLPMGINLVDEGTDYDKDESKYGATSTSDGKENTLKIFKALEGYVAEQINYAAQGMTAPPVFSPAGFCMMMNEEWWDINLSLIHIFVLQQSKPAKRMKKICIYQT